MRSLKKQKKEKEEKLILPPIFKSMHIFNGPLTPLAAYLLSDEKVKLLVGCVNPFDRKKYCIDEVQRQKGLVEMGAINPCQATCNECQFTVTYN